MRKWISIACAVVFLAAVGGPVAWHALTAPNGPKLCHCGHVYVEKPLIHRVLGAGRYERHHCLGWKAVSDLKSVHIANRIFEYEQGRWANDIDELVREGLWSTNSWNRWKGAMKLHVHDAEWWVTGSKTNGFPGHYLMLEDERVYFHPDRPAQVGDEMLRPARGRE